MLTTVGDEHGFAFGNKELSLDYAVCYSENPQETDSILTP